MLDYELLKETAKLFLKAIGEDPEREGLKETPERFARKVMEQYRYNGVPNEAIAREFGKCFESPSTDMVVVKDIDIYSHCEHHLALMYDMKVSVGYIPSGKVIGLSKIARIADAVGKRLQIQERIGSDIVDIIKMVTGTENVIVYIEGKHSCMTYRGINKPGTVTRTISTSGAFKLAAYKEQFFSMIK